MECGACQMNCPFGAIQVDSGVGCAQAIIAAALRRGTLIERQPIAATAPAPTCGTVETSAVAAPACGESVPVESPNPPIATRG
ncbi:MAG: hypothetical protein FVQ83_03600 [Chloroflexi bacterium]|nr:hypothetical protein [Chloroflexota bacterium]